ncbi:hypothetical protein ABBQ32_003121 [Trebouxia sp. C0010 RCD-2024]
MVSWRILDYLVVAGYLVVTAGLGVYFSKGNKTTEDFFLGSRGLPGWAVGFSLLSTTMSSVTFLAYPATSYILDWRLYTKDFLYPAISVFTALLVAPRFRKSIQSASVYEFLESRFGLECRLFGGATYVVSQLLKLCTTLYLMAVPISMLLGAPLPMVIVFTGVFVTCYSMAGGISAVVYTDVCQSVILLVGGLVSVVAIVSRVPGGITVLAADAHRHNKLSLGKTEWSWQERTVPTVLAYAAVHYMTKFITFQDAVQRYLAVPSHKELLKAMSLTASLALPTWALFYFIGTCLWAFYRAYPDPRVANLPPDAVFPSFILHELPSGVAGVVISGVLAAAMSTMDSSLNATASVVVTDLIQRCLLPHKPDRFYLRCARCVTLAAATFMICSALVLEYLPMESLNDWYNSMQSIMGGAVISLFLIALYAPWFTKPSMLVAIAVSLLSNVFLMAGCSGLLPPTGAIFGFFSRLNSYWVAPLVNLVFIAAAVLTQLFLATVWGKAVLAWLAQKPFSTMKASSLPLDVNPEDIHRCNLYEPETEHQRLLASADLQGMQSCGVSGAQSAVRLEPLYEGPAAFSVEMADLDALRQHTNLQEDHSQPGNKA